MVVVALSAQNRITWGKDFLRLKCVDQNSPTPLLFGISHSMHGTLQVMKFSTSMDLRMFESVLQLVLYFKGWRTHL